MTRQAQVGAFALFALLLLFGVFYVVTDFGTRHTGYRIGVHFESAAGLHSGALVYFSGVSVGTVDSIKLLPDNTVDVIVAVNRDVDIPRDSEFLIQAPLTGDPSLMIVPPKTHSAVALERTVLPVDQQPKGTNTATVADLLQEGQGEIAQLDSMLKMLAEREPKLLDSLQATLDNANSLTSTMKTAFSGVGSSLGEAGKNIVALTSTLNDTTQLNSGKITDMLTQFDETSRALNASMAQLQDLAQNKALKANLLATTQNIAETTQTIAELTKDFRSITGDPQTQAQIKSTIANLDATMQKANSLLGSLGGTSSVYGVDAGATPYPAPTATGPVFPGASPFPGVTPYPAPSGGPSHATTTAKQLQLKNRLGGIAKNLVAIQLRMEYLSPQTACCNNPLLSSDRGPQTDFNAVILPHATTSFLVGANDIGYHSTANVALLESLGSHARVGGGVLYSQLGFLGQYNTGFFGLEGRVYDPRYPTLDLYGNFHITKGIELFVGERDVSHPERRTVYGFQTQFP